MLVELDNLIKNSSSGLKVIYADQDTKNLKLFHIALTETFKARRVNLSYSQER